MRRTWWAGLGLGVAAALAPSESFAQGAASSPSVIRDCTNICPELVVVPAGSFDMGSPASETGRASDEGPVRKVTFVRPFAVGRFEVTFAEWDACLAEGGCQGPPAKAGDAGFGRGRQPVINVSWDDAQTYLAWLGKKTGKPYRLLTEAEWEYATRAGSTTKYWWGDEPNHDADNYAGVGGKDDRTSSPIAAGTLDPNPFGLHETLGNVAEWVEDCWKPDYKGAPANGAAVTVKGCRVHVIRGASWMSDTPLHRSANRDWVGADYRSATTGFRVARNL